MNGRVALSINQSLRMYKSEFRAMIRKFVMIRYP